MSALSIIARKGTGFLLLFALVIAPWIAVAGHFRAAVTGAALIAVLAWLAATLWGERAVIRALGGGQTSGREELAFGIGRSFARVLQALEREGAGMRAPRLAIVSDPVPQAWVTRSLLGGGTLLLSQGLLAVLSEAELRSVMTWGCARLRFEDMTFKSACVCLSQLWLREWQARTPLAALWVWSRLPLARLMLWIGGEVDPARARVERRFVDHEAWHSALTKVRQMQPASPIGPAGGAGFRAARMLQLFAPELARWSDYAPL